MGIKTRKLPGGDDPEAIQAWLRATHDRVDRGAAKLEARHAGRLQCRRGCSPCCTDGITVFDVEAERIRRVHRDLLETDRPGPIGGCAFLDADGACRIYEDRPYVCRTQGLPLRWREFDPNNGISGIERRDICPLNDEGEPIEKLKSGDCWSIGPIERRLAQLQVRSGRGMKRVHLRDLFQSGQPEDRV